MYIVDDACGRYTLSDTHDLSKRFNLATKGPENLKPNYNTAPGQFMPVVVKDEARKNRLDIMKWGLIPHWAKDTNIGYKLINTRDDTAFVKPLWKAAISHYRCLIPSNGFYEWKRTEAKYKVPYFIHPKDQTLFAFAGLWSTWENHNTGEIIHSYSIMTTEPNKEMRAVHNRMPVILKPDEEAKWLEPSMEDKSSIAEFLHPYEDGGLEIYEVSRDVNSTSNNYESLVKPVTE